jgi:hypothetical protein
MLKLRMQENYSFSGALTPLSKLIVCLVMIRGRHRGLPVAIDRAVMLPMEFAAPRNPDAEQHTPAEGSGNEPPANGSSANEKSSDDADRRLRRNARRPSNEEASLGERRKAAARADQEVTFGY